MNKIKEAYQKIPIQTRAAFWFMFCSMFPQAVTVISTTIFTRILTTGDYGLTSNYSAWHGIVDIFVTLSLYCGVYNNAMLKYKEHRDEFDASIVGISFMTSGVFMIFMLMFHAPMERVTALSTSMLICMWLQCLFANSYNCWISRARYEYNYVKIIKVTIVTALLSPILSLLFIVLFENNAAAKVWGQNLCMIVIGAALCIRTLRRRLPLYNKEYWRYALSFNIPLIPHYLSIIILNQSDRIMITRICGLSENGIYSIAYSAASLLLIFNSAVTQALTPWIYERCSDKRVSNVKKYVSVIYFLAAGIVLAFMMLAPEAVSILAGEKYQQSVGLIPPIAVGIYFILVQNMTAIIEFYHEKSKMLMVCSSIAAVLNIVLNLIFIPVYGYTAAAYTTLASYAVNAMLHYWIVHTIYKKNYPGECDFMCNKLSFLLAIPLTAFSVFSKYIYENWQIRFGIVALVLLMIILNKKKLMAILEVRKKEKQAAC